MRDAGYRTREEVEEWRARDPIKRLRDRLLLDRLAEPGTLDSLDREMQTLAAEALEWDALIVVESNPTATPGW